MARGGHGLPIVSPWPAMPCLSMPCRRATPETALWPFQEWPARRESGLWPSLTPLDTPRRTPMRAIHLSISRVLRSTSLSCGRSDVNSESKLELSSASSTWGHRRMAWGVQRGRRWLYTVRPFQGWPARRAYKSRAWQARVKLYGVHPCHMPMHLGVEGRRHRSCFQRFPVDLRWIPGSGR
jgi:hypothetical protein